MSSKAEYLPTSSDEKAEGLPSLVVDSVASRRIQPSSCALMPRRTLARGAGAENSVLPQYLAKAPARLAWATWVTSHHPVSVSRRNILGLSSTGLTLICNCNTPHAKRALVLP